MEFNEFMNSYIGKQIAVQKLLWKGGGVGSGECFMAYFLISLELRPIKALI